MRRQLLALYALSGAVALVYEVVWTRLLSLHLGHTIAAASAVLAAFMGGLAIGALIAGARSNRVSPRAALRTYAVLEIGVAAYALCLPSLLTLAQPLLATVYRDGAAGWSFGALRVALALVLVGLPASAMGATYPLLVRAAGARIGADVLYAVNTIGAAIGALAAGFLLLPSFGIFRSTLTGVAAGALVGAIAWRLAGGLGNDVSNLDAPRVSRAPPGTSSRQKKTVEAPVSLRDGILSAAIAGFIALALEIAWTRALAVVLGPTIYAFSAMLAAFIIGLAAGSSVGTWLVRRMTTGAQGLVGVLFAATALSTAVAVARLDDVFLEVATRAADPGAQWSAVFAAGFWQTLLLLMPIACSSGALFPAALAIAGATSSARNAAIVYAANTGGAILGALGAGLALIPRIGLLRTVQTAAVVAIVGAVASSLRAQRHRMRIVSGTAAVAVGAAAILMRSPWDPMLMSSGGYKYAPYLGARDLRELLTAGTLRYYREGASATVAVRDLAGVRSLSIDGKVDASTGNDMLTQRMLAHIPLLMHAAPANVAIVGLGSGVTLAAALTHPISSTDVIEISPEVVDASAWFSSVNRNALRDPRVRLIVGDARSHFRMATRRYDVIVSEPSNPWMAGVAALFTREFFEALRARLATDGLVCQWAHTYDISETDLKSIVATFASVFAEVTLWLVGDGDLLMIGGIGADRQSGSLPGGARRPDAARDLAAAGISSADAVQSLLVGGTAFARSWGQGAALQVDDRMALEFSAPREIVGRTAEDQAAMIVSASAGLPGWKQTFMSSAGAARQAGLLHLRSGAVRRAWMALDRAVALGADDAETIEAYGRSAGGADQVAATESRLRALVDRSPSNSIVRLELARLLAGRGEFSEARTQALRAWQLTPDERAAERLAAIAADAQDVDGLSSAVARLTQCSPDSSTTAYYRATLAYFRGQPDAPELARRSAEARPSHGPSWTLLGAALASSGASPDSVRDAFSKAIAADPSDAAGYVNLATFELEQGRQDAAARLFAEGLTVDPQNRLAREGLSRARRRR
jgi:spermidine synthase